MLYVLTRALIRFLLWIFVDFDVEGLENIPAKGPALLVCNHVNLMDPVVPIGLTKRRVSFMVKEEIMSWPIMGNWFRLLGLVPVSRGKIASRRAIARAEEQLGRGLVFCVYPEGTRSHEPGMGPAHNGAALLAMRTGVPILPAAITGTHMVLREGCSFPTRGQVTFRIGEPLQIERVSGRIERPQLEYLTEVIMRRIAALLPPEYRGVYGLEPAVAESGQ